MLHLLTIGDKQFKVPCIILQETEDGVWIDLPQVPDIINTPCVQLVAKETLSEN